MSCYVKLQQLKILIGILSFCIITFTIEVCAQVSYGLRILESNGEALKDIVDYEKSFKDSLLRHKQLQRVLSELYEQGYLAASFDSVSYARHNLNAVITKGGVYKWATINADLIDEGVLSSIGFRDKLFYKKSFSHQGVRSLQEALLNYCENHGYPFAIVKLDSLYIDGEEISAVLTLDKNKEYKIDSIEIKGDAKISMVYLSNFIGISKGDLYNEGLIRDIGVRIKELRFVKETKPVQVEFSKDAAKLVLNLKGNQASLFTGMVGVMPKNKDDGSLLVTGEARLKLLNSLGHGELMDINWRSLQPRTQDLKSRLVYPFMFSSPFGADVNFTLYKKDTLYIDLISNIGIQYLLRGGNFLKVFVTNKETRLLAGYLPGLPYGNVKSTIYGIGYKSQKLDYLFNPRKGHSLLLDIGAGNKRIRTDPDLNPDSVEYNSTEIEGKFTLDLFFPLTQRNVLNLGIAGGYRSSKSMFENELFRLGGISTLRGFDEESILASIYSVYTFEYRYLLEQNSYLFLFFDGAYYENEVAQIKGKDWSDNPIGYGAGISFETKAGIFSINYAIGQQKGNPIDIRAAKVHFGIVNRF